MSSPAPVVPGQAPMYEEFYQFGQPPFTLAPDPRFLYRSGSHDEAITSLLQAIRRREGFIVLSGDIGTGKTTVCRALVQQLDANTFTSLILNPFLSVEELLREILLDFGVVSKEAVRSGRILSASKLELLRTLEEFLQSLKTIRGSGVLIIDEAQHLSADVLEEIRIISTLESNEAHLLQIVLVGQPNLLETLAGHGMRQLHQRISLKAVLQPLDRNEVEAYIAHRLRVATGGETVTFAPNAIDQVHAYSGGVPRVINLLCDRALMVSADGRVNAVTSEIIHQAAERLSLPSLRPPAIDATAHARRWVMVAACVAILVAALLLFAPLYRFIEIPAAPAPSVPPQLRTTAPLAQPAPPEAPAAATAP